MLKSLSIICCLILFLPFFQTCSDESLTKFPFKNIEIVDESGNPSQAILKRKVENTLTGFEICLVYVFSPFTIVIIFTFLSVLYAFRKAYKALLIVTILNILLNILFLGWLSFDGIIEDIKQIKYGYYLFFIALITQLFYSKINFNKKKPMLSHRF